MSRAPLPHVYAQWETPENDPLAEDRLVYRGRMRLVKNRRRMRKLKRRGVDLMDCRLLTEHGYVGPKCFAWFTPLEEVPE